MINKIPFTVIPGAFKYECIMLSTKVDRSVGTAQPGLYLHTVNQLLTESELPNFWMSNFVQFFRNSKNDKEIFMNTIPVSKSLRMTSREIAELTGKRHDHVLRDIDNIIKSTAPNLGASIKSTTYIDSKGEERRQYELDFRASMLVINGYNDNLRLRVIDRWQELEEQAIAQATKLAEATTWEQQRQVGKEVRANFTNTLTDHGVKGFGYAQCTNGIYRPLFGNTAANLKKTTWVK